MAAPPAPLPSNKLTAILLPQCLQDLAESGRPGRRRAVRSSPRRCRIVVAALLGAALRATGAVVAQPPAAASIDAHGLGARYDSTGSNITFRVYSATATRIAVYLYGQPTGAQENASYLLTEDDGDVFARTVSMAALRDAGISGTAYYGYRAWGPNWPYTSSWTKGSSAGFIDDVDVDVDVDAAGNRFNPNNCCATRTSWVRRT